MFHDGERAYEVREKSGLGTKILRCVWLLGLCVGLFLLWEESLAKSLYMIADTNNDPTPIHAYDIQDPNLVFQSMIYVPSLSGGVEGGGVGIAIDEYYSILFVTYEGSDSIQLIDATSMANLGTTRAPEAQDLAGIVLDQGYQKLYCVDRGTNQLYVYDWKVWSKTLSLVSGAPFTLQGMTSGAFGIALDESDDVTHVLYVTDYDAQMVRAYEASTDINTTPDPSRSFSVSHKPIGIAIDMNNQFVYTGGGWGYSPLLTRYDLNHNVEDLSPDVSGAMGIAVDQGNGNVYITTGFIEDKLKAFNSNLNQLWSSSVLAGDPTGICIPIQDISYNPLFFRIQTDTSDRPIDPNNRITYHLSFYNPGPGTITTTTLYNPIPSGTSCYLATEPATHSGSLDEVFQPVTWNFGTVEPGEFICVDLILKVTASPGDMSDDIIMNMSTLTSTLSDGNTVQVTRKFYNMLVPEASSDQYTTLTQSLVPNLPDAELFETFGTLTLITNGGSFAPTSPTFIISHGFNSEGGSTMPLWQQNMGNEINAELGGSVNVFLWNWQDHAGALSSSSFPVPYHKVESAGKNLAYALEGAGIPADYSDDIHLIGHSLGTGVIVYATKYIDIDYQNNIRENIKHFTFLDSPYRFAHPGGSFLADYVKDANNIFLDNYYSQKEKFFGSTQISLGFDMNWFSGYKCADTNVNLWNLDLSSDNCGHQWYLSSITAFDDPTILGDTTVPLPSAIDYGFAWYASLRSSSQHYTHILPDPNTPSPKWEIQPGYWDPNISQVVNKSPWIAGSVEYQTGVATELTENAKNLLNEYAANNSVKIIIYEVNSFNALADIADFIVDTEEHALWVLGDATITGGEGAYGVLQLTISSEATVSTEITISDQVNALRYSFEFPLVDPNCILETFIDNAVVNIIYADDYTGRGWQYSEWIDISSVAGDTVDLSFRLSNTGEDMQGIVNIDELLFAKIMPAVDADKDGVIDSEDNCPNRDNPSQTDTDNDGVGDVCDECPNDPYKIMPGICNCGFSDIDTDSDGTYDCDDGCDNDPNKIVAGICGCGVSDRDTDNDGASDCVDDLPNDPNEQVDTDSDGTGDNSDECDNDPAKIVIGECGCGIPETDSDNDGTPDCNDGCDNDSNKVIPGACGCGVSDTDSDSDGSPDCIDDLPNDPNEQTDTDGDGTGDNSDECPNDPAKVVIGECGCGTPETDSDNDGTPDCNDEFPQDPTETVDNDGDGIGNNADTDDDNDSIPDLWEVTYNINPLVNDAAQDPDSDGYQNIQEYISGTDPLDSNSTPQPPAADAGNDQTVNEGVTVTLDGSGSSDADDGITSYQWTQTVGPSITLYGAYTARPTFTAPLVNSTGTTLIFQLTVEDSGGLLDTDEITVIVNDVPVGSDEVELKRHCFITLH
ncbi:MAG: PKD domain-containing protein [bacterium]